MTEPRLKTEFRVRAMLRTAAARAAFGAVLRRGDPDAGSVLVVLRGHQGLCVLSETRDGEGAATWLRATGPSPVTQTEADLYVERQARNDPDVWVVEFEMADLLPPFEAVVLT